MKTPSPFCTHAAAVGLAIWLVGCEARSDARQPQQPPPQRIDRLLSFTPAANPKAADAWSRLRAAPRDERAPIREELARLYAAADYRAMEAFMLAANEVTGPRSKPPADTVLRSRDPLWACPPTSAIADAGAVAEIDRHMQAADYRAARDTGLHALQRSGPICSLQMETAVATLALAATSQPVAPTDFELALRTFITADAEVHLRPQQGGRSWPYALAARALINYDPPAALVAAVASRQLCESEQCSDLAAQNAEKEEAYIRGLFR